MSEKVLVLASVASMVQQFNMPFIRILQEMEYKVHVACNFIRGNTCSDEAVMKLKETLDGMDVKYYQIDFSRNMLNVVDNAKAYRQVKSLLNENKYKFLHCHSPIGGVIGRLTGHRFNTKVVYTAHGFHFYKGAPLLNWLLYFPIEKLCSWYTDVLVTINQEDFALAKKRMRAKKVFYVPGVGIDTKKYTVNENAKETKRREIGIPEDAIILLSVGELTKRKNHERIINTFAKINNRNVHYIVVGKGKLKDYLIQKAKELNVLDRFHLLDYREDIVDLYSMADIFCFPSLMEGLPVSLMEAMAVGLPVVCSDIRGNNDLIDDGKGGFLIRNQDLNDFTSKIELLIEDPFLRNSMGEHNTEKIRKFDSDEVNSKMKFIYQSMERRNYE